MALDDPPLPCIGSVHVPGCDHFTPGAAGFDHAAVVEQLEETIRLQDEARVTAVTRELAMTLTIAITRRGRRRCPICGLRRELFSLTAFAVDQPVGYGTAKCLACAGLRR